MSWFASSFMNCPQTSLDDQNKQKGTKGAYKGSASGDFTLCVLFGRTQMRSGEGTMNCTTWISADLGIGISTPDGTNRCAVALNVLIDFRNCHGCAASLLRCHCPLFFSGFNPTEVVDAGAER